MKQDGICDETVLIETLWNVNLSPSIKEAAGDDRINRNIVECKLMKCKKGVTWKPVLIETLWNVNQFYDSQL